MPVYKISELTEESIKGSDGHTRDRRQVDRLL